MSNFTFELVSPEHLLLSAEVSEVNIPGAEGYMTIMANHSPLMASIKPGVITVVKADGSKEEYAVFGGFVDATPAGCTVLAESATLVSELDASDISDRVAAAEEVAKTATEDMAMANAAAHLDNLKSLQAMVAGR